MSRPADLLGASRFLAEDPGVLAADSDAPDDPPGVLAADPALLAEDPRDLPGTPGVLGNRHVSLHRSATSAS